MAYNITLTNGQNLVTVADGTTDTTYTSLTLIGKNYAGYGEIQNENFVHLLENFSNSSAPFSPLQGQIWWDSTNKILKVYNGGNWKTVGSSTASASAPAGAVPGDLWWDTANSQLNAWTGASWALIGPLTKSENGTTGIVADVVQGAGDGLSHVIVKLYVGGDCVAILSKDPAFMTNNIAGFSVIKPGINLAVTMPALAYYGDADNALKLGGLPASAYARTDTAPNFGQSVHIQNNNGLTVGENNDLQVTVDATTVNIKSVIHGKDLRIHANSSGSPTVALSVSGNNGLVTVAANPESDMGIATKKYVDDHAYSLPAASMSEIGGIRVGHGLSIDAAGTLSAIGYALPAATPFSLGGIKIGAGLQIDNSGTVTAQEYVLPKASGSSLGGIKVGAGLAIDGNGVLSNALGDVMPVASGSVLGAVRIGPGIQVDENGMISVNQYSLPAATSTTLGAVKIGSGINYNNNTISVTPYTLPFATANTLGGVKVGNGLTIDSTGTLSAAVTAQFVMPVATANVLGGVKVGPGIQVDDNGTISVNAYSLPAATSSTLGAVKIGSGINYNNNTISVTPYTLPTASATILGGIKVGAGLAIDSLGTLSAVTSSFLTANGPLATPSSGNLGNCTNLPGTSVVGNIAGNAYNITQYVINQNLSLTSTVKFAGVTTTGDIRAGGNVIAYDSSDERLKINVEPITDAINKVKQLRGVSYDWTEAYLEARGGADGNYIKEHDVGVIAQETEKVFPEVVGTNEEGYKGVKYEKLVPVLIEAIKELAAEIEALRAKVQ